MIMIVNNLIHFVWQEIIALISIYNSSILPSDDLLGSNMFRVDI